MSERERASVLLGQVPQYKLGYAIAYLQGLVADVMGDSEEVPNAVTIAALREGDEMLRTGSGQGWTGSTEELFKQILEENDDDDSDRQADRAV